MCPKDLVDCMKTPEANHSLPFKLFFRPVPHAYEQSFDVIMIPWFAWQTDIAFIIRAALFSLVCSRFSAFVRFRPSVVLRYFWYVFVKALLKNTYVAKLWFRDFLTQVIYVE
jgi:hypothetical protein